MTDAFAHDCISTLAVMLLFVASGAAGVQVGEISRGIIVQGVRASFRKPTFTMVDALMHIYLHLHEGALIKALNH